MNNWGQEIPYEAIARLTSGRNPGVVRPTAEKLPLPDPPGTVPQRVFLVVFLFFGTILVVAMAAPLGFDEDWSVMIPVGTVALLATQFFLISHLIKVGTRERRRAGEIDPQIREAWARGTIDGPFPTTVLDRRTDTSNDSGKVLEFTVLVDLDGTLLPARWRANPKPSDGVLQTQVPVVGSTAQVWPLRGNDIYVVDVVDPTGESGALE